VVALVVVSSSDDPAVVADPAPTATTPAVTDVPPEAPSSSPAGDAGSEVAALRDEAAAAAESFVVAVNTYGPDDLTARGTLDGYADRVRDGITAEFAAEFDESLDLAEQTVVEAGYERTVETNGRGVSYLSESSAEVLVAGVISGSYPDTDGGAASGARVELEPQPFRFMVSVARAEDGGWLVDDFAPIEDDAVYTDDGESGELIEDDAVAARTAAVAAAPALLSYDYRTLDDDFERGVAVTTDEYGSTYTELFDSVIRVNAPKSRTVVTATVMEAGVVEVRTGEVVIIVAVNRPTTNADTRQPEVYKDYAIVTMVDVDGTWLLDDLTARTG
jgi:Mce-associated membrane protein